MSLTLNASLPESGFMFSTAQSHSGHPSCHPVVFLSSESVGWSVELCDVFWELETITCSKGDLKATLGVSGLWDLCGHPVTDHVSSQHGIAILLDVVDWKLRATVVVENFGKRDCYVPMPGFSHLGISLPLATLLVVSFSYLADTFIQSYFEFI